MCACRCETRHRDEAGGDFLTENDLVWLATVRGVGNLDAQVQFVADVEPGAVPVVRAAVPPARASQSLV